MSDCIKKQHAQAAKLYGYHAMKPILQVIPSTADFDGAFIRLAVASG